MNNNIKEGLEGLSKMDGITDFLFTALYWVGVIFVLLFIAYIFVSIYIMIQDRKRGIDTKDKDDYLDD